VQSWGRGGTVRRPGSPLIIPVAPLAGDESKVPSGASMAITVLRVWPSFFLESPEVQRSDRARLRLKSHA
jgi:hypothetical protein